MYINGRWLIEPEIRAYIHKLEEERNELKQEKTVVLREEKGKLIAEYYEAKKLLRESLPVLHRAFFANYKDTNAANELYDRIKQTVGGAENEDQND